MRKYNICVKAALAVFAGLLSACSSDNDIAEKEPASPEKPVVSQTMTFHASMDGENTTRTSFDNDNNTVWSDGDAIHVQNTATSFPDGNVNNHPTDGGDFTIPSGGGGGKAADFTGSPIWINGDGTSDQFYAFYPSSSFNTTSKKMTGNIQTVQTAMDGTYDQSLHFMTAYSTNTTFAFKNVCALLKITLNGNSTDNSNPVCRVKVVANPGIVVSRTVSWLGITGTYDYDQSFTYTSIAGNFEATVKNDGTASVTPKEEKKTYVELRASGDDGTAKTSLGNGTFYMVVLPAALSKDDVTYGFTILLEKKDGTIYQRVNTKQKAFERNKMYDLGSYDCSGTPTGMTAYTNVVDLDLPSGTLWCKYNIKKNGSFESSETGFTDFFSWGDDHVNLASTSTGKFEDDPATNFSLYADYDVVYSNNNSYCMPIYAQMYEMYNHTNKVIDKETHTTLGFTITDAAWAKFTAATGTGRYIKIPYAGYYYNGRHKAETEEARYWSRTKASNVEDWAGDAFCMDLIEGTGNVPAINGDWVDDINTGRTIRPVATNIKIAPILTK